MFHCISLFYQMYYNYYYWESGHGTEQQAGKDTEDCKAAWTDNRQQDCRAAVLDKSDVETGSGNFDDERLSGCPSAGWIFLYRHRAGGSIDQSNKKHSGQGRTKFTDSDKRRYVHL